MTTARQLPIGVVVIWFLDIDAVVTLSLAITPDSVVNYRTPTSGWCGSHLGAVVTLVRYSSWCGSHLGAVVILVR